MISLDEFETTLSAAFAALYRPYAGALASFAHAPGADGEPDLVSCRWLFADEPLPPRAPIAYPVLVLEESWLPMEVAAGELLRLLRGETTVGPCRLREPVAELEKLDASREKFTGWREVAFAASSGYRHTYDVVPVVAKGLRPYPSVGAAVSDWVWRKRSDPRLFLPFSDLGTVRVLLPDTRARIRKASWVGGTLRLLNDRNAAPDDVELQGVVVEQQTSTVLEPRAVEEEVEWEVPADADVVEVYLVHRDGTLLSHRTLTRGEHYGARPGDVALRERAEEELRQGENERVEYKPFIEAKNVKEHELVQTVVAFSNTFGGRLYVGVKDDGTPQGEVELRKVGKASEEQSLDSVVRQIGKLVRNEIKPVPSVDVNPITAFGSPVVVVDVSAGEDAPYSTLKNDMFVRKGASNCKPDPQTELPP